MLNFFFIIALDQMNKKITELRLQKEQQSLEKQPHHQALVTRVDFLNFHFCLFGLQEDFAKGFYHGVLELPEDYPFSPPKIKFFTENGRFDVGKPICTTFTHYHKQTWSSSWNIRTIITGLISFMYTAERGIGGIFDSPARRRSLAKKSLANNLGNPLFVQIFKQTLISRQIVPKKEIQQLIKRNTVKDAKKIKMRNQNLTSSQYRDEQREEILEKDNGQVIIKVQETLQKAVTELKLVIQENIIEETMQPRKKIHFQELVVSPLLNNCQTMPDKEAPPE